jgi:succinate dehydrogenase hydrophobic anchor subunit
MTEPWLMQSFAAVALVLLIVSVVLIILSAKK